MAQDLNALFRFKGLRSYPLTAMHMIMGTRLCIMFGQAGRDPTPDLAVRLRSMDAARLVARLVRSIQELWPEPFLVHRPCCMALSPDETLLGDLVVAATRGDEDSAVVMMRDVFPADTSRHLFRETVGAAAAIQPASAGMAPSGCRARRRAPPSRRRCSSGTRARSRVGSTASIRRKRSSSFICDQRAISEVVRRQPTQSPSSSNVQTPMHGLSTARKAVFISSGTCGG